MDARIKALWLDTLRSDEFEQGTGVLCRPDMGGGKKTACCLGVLSELAAREGIVEPVYTPDDLDGDVYRYGEMLDAYFLPLEVQDWAGLTDHNPFAGEHPLSKYNDGDEQADLRPHDFREIADLIEAHL